MKRSIVFILAVVALCLTAVAQRYTNLAVEAVFDGRYNDHPSTSVSIIKNPESIFRSLSVSGNQKIVSEVERLVRKDASKCTSPVETYSQGEYRLIFSIGEASIGFTKTGKSEAELWVNCPTNSSSGRRKTSKSSSRSSSKSSKSKKPSSLKMPLTARNNESHCDRQQHMIYIDDNVSIYSY